MALRITAPSRFHRTWKQLNARQRERIGDIIIALPDLLKNPHRHSGFGFRRIHGTSLYEARLDLRWRLVMQITATEIVLYDVLNHDQIRRI